ncbi:MAG: tetratricopeptide repeat protein, partial [Planctomycetales bacterium]
SQGLRDKALEEAAEALLREREFEFPEDLVASDAVWKYHDRGDDLGTDWRSAEFDDSAWPEGSAPLGYGLDTESTVIASGEFHHKHAAAYFRARFQAPNPETVDELYLKLHVDDGAAVYLNGEEVVRFNLRRDAKANDLALFAASDNGKSAVYFPISGKLLRPRENVLAIEVHQENRASADLHFVAALSSKIPEFPETTNNILRQRQVAMVGQLGPSLAGWKDRVLRFYAGGDEVTKVQALIALIRLDADGKGSPVFPWPVSAQQTQLRLLFSQSLTNQYWNVVKDADRTRQQLQRARAFLRVAHVLSPNEAGFCNSLGLADYRLGNYKNAVKMFRKSLSLKPDNPYDYAMLSMA